MPKIVEVPNVGNVEFPDSMDVNQISMAIQKQYGPAKSSFWSEAADAAIGAAKGFVKSAGDTVRTLSAWSPMASPARMAQLGVDSVVGKPAAITPQGTAENVGAGIERAGEMMLASGPLKQAATSLAALAPAAAARYAAPAARIAAEAVNGGINATAHEESPTTGALAGAAGGVLGEAASSVAPKLAESALGVRIKDRLRGKTPGQAILNDTKGLTAATVEETASQQAADLTTKLESAARRSPPRASIRNAVGAIDDEIQKATQENSADTVKKLEKIKQQLTTDITTGQPFPNNMSPLKLIQLKRGVGKLIKTWNPEEATSVQSAVERVYGNLTEELERTVPQASQINQRLASLIPVEKRAESAANTGGVVGELVERLKRPTGALVGSAVGAGIGYKEGGMEGAAKGAALGLAPSLVVNPTTMLTAARLANSPALRNFAIPGMEGVTLQMLGHDGNGNLLMRPVPAADPENAVGK